MYRPSYESRRGTADSFQSVYMHNLSVQSDHNDLLLQSLIIQEFEIQGVRERLIYR